MKDGKISKYNDVKNMKRLENTSPSTKENILLSINLNETVRLNSEANSQLFQAYKGVRYDANGTDIGHKGRSLKDISKYKVNPNFESQNIKQQSGFSAELLIEAKQNRRNILENNSNKMRTADGLGRINDPVNDIYTVDTNGKLLQDSKGQVKFLTKSNNPNISHQKVVDNFVNDPKWEKYYDTDILIPSEQYESAKQYARDLKSKYKKQLQKSDNLDVKEKLNCKIKKLDRLERSLKDSGVSSDEAISARINPKKYVIFETTKNINSSSLEAAKGVAIFSGSLSIGKNIYSLVSNEKTLEDAIFDTTKETVSITTKAYFMNFTSESLAITMRNAKNSVVRRLGNTSFPLAISTGVVEIGKSIKRYLNNDIDEGGLLLELGEKGTSALAANYGALVGTMIMPGVGTILGSMCGYTLSGMFYHAAVNILCNEKIAEQKRKIIEAATNEAINSLNEYHERLKVLAFEREKYRNEVFNKFIFGIEKSSYEYNIEEFFESIDGLASYFGLDLKFKSFNEFDDFMKNDKEVLIF